MIIGKNNLLILEFMETCLLVVECLEIDLWKLEDLLNLIWMKLEKKQFKNFKLTYTFF